MCNAAAILAQAQQREQKAKLAAVAIDHAHHEMNRINAVINNPCTTSEQKLSSIRGIVSAFEDSTGPFEQMDEFGCTPYDSMMANVASA